MNFKKQLIVLLFIAPVFLFACGLAGKLLRSLNTEYIFQKKEEAILADQEMFSNPKYWDIAPKSCSKSMLIVESPYYENGVLTNAWAGGSGSLVYSQRYHKGQTVVTVYTILTAEHVTGKFAPGTTDVYITPANHNYIYTYHRLQSRSITADDGSDIDMSLISVYMEGESSDVQDQRFEALGLENVYPGNGFEPVNDGAYFSFGYPLEITREPHFTLGKATEYLDQHRVNILVDENFSDITHGDSGGAICNSDGELVGVVKSINSGSVGVASEYIATYNPVNIKDQISDFLAFNDQIMSGVGYLVGFSDPVQ